MGHLNLESLSISGLRAAVATGVSRNEKELFADIINGSYDLIAMPGADSSSARKLERLGVRCVHVSMSDHAKAFECGRGEVAASEWLAEPMLSISAVPVSLEAYRIDFSDVAAYAELSGDSNRLHFDDAYARGLGFDGRISHGMIFNSWVTSYLGTKFPGEGTIFLRNTTSYFAPVYPGRAYSIRISVPSMDVDKGLYKILFQLREGSAGSMAGLAMLSYNDVMLRRPSQ